MESVRSCISVKFTTVATVAVVGAGVGTIYYLFSRLKNNPKEVLEPVRELLLFPDDRPTCKSLYTERKGCHNPQCRYSHDENSSFNKLMKHLTSARQSIDLCVFCFTSPELADIIVTLHQRGLRVRFITDNEQVDASNSQVGKFRREGILVRHNRTSYLMHHKFAIIDKKKLINGSFNWTRQAITGNNENVLVTSDSSLVIPFQQEFNKLWDQFNPENITS